MMRVAVVVLVLVVAMAAAHPQERSISNSTAANFVLDNIIVKAVERIKDLGWNREASLPIHEASGTNEIFAISNVVIKGLGSLRRYNSASLNSDQTVLSGTIGAENITITADYSATFLGVDAAPAQSLSGTVTETFANFFAYLEINLDGDLIPLSIKSYTVRSGQDRVSVSAPQQNAGYRETLRRILKNTMAANIKVMIKLGVVDVKAAAFV